MGRAQTGLRAGMAIAAAVSFAGHGGAARAASPDTRGIGHASTPLSLESLPAGKVLDVDWSGQPRAVPRKATIPGLVVERLSRVDDQSFVSLAQKENGSPVCLDSFQRTTAPGEPPEASTWSPVGETTQLSLTDTSPFYSRVGQAHIEELLHEAGGVVLQMRDAWVDIATGGARVHATSRLPLRDLGAFPQGLHLYGGRTENDVVFVVVRPKLSVSLTVSRDGNGAGTECSHVTIRLGGKRGISRTVLVDNVTRLPDAASDEVPASQADLNPTTMEDLRRRAGHVALSWSWELSDPAPLVAVSSGWNGRASEEEASSMTSPNAF